MSINQVIIENNIPKLSEQEFRIMERKDVKSVIDFQRESFSEEGTLFLTTRRLVFLSTSCKVLSSFEIDIENIDDCHYSKRGAQKVIEGLGSAKKTRAPDCKFSFFYNGTGFRSIVSLFFSIFNQAKSIPAFSTSPGIKS